jgi:AcrR family transcriptional regulator
MAESADRSVPTVIRARAGRATPATVPSRERQHAATTVRAARSLHDEFRAHVRARVLAVAAPLAVEPGWERVRLTVLADACGLSRATLHREFGGKRGIAAALIEGTAERLLSRASEALDHSASVETGILRAFAIAVEHSSNDPLLASILAGRPHGGTDLLALMTIDSLPVHNKARDLLVRYLQRRLPTLNRTVTDDAADTIVRLIAGHLVARELDDGAMGERLVRVVRRLLRP